MKKNKIITSVLAMALVLIAVILIVITVGLFKTTKKKPSKDRLKPPTIASLPRFLHVYWN